MLKHSQSLLVVVGTRIDISGKKDWSGALKRIVEAVAVPRIVVKEGGGYYDSMCAL